MIYNKNTQTDIERIGAETPEGVRAEYFSVIDSTNSECRRRVQNGDTRALLLVADEQTAGRGRQGKSFYSPADTGIYFSLLLPAKDSFAPETLTCAAAVAVCRAVEALTALEPKIKWVNDIYIDGKKVCGILTEALCAPSGERFIIIGIGINITTRDFPPGVENGGALGADIDRNALVIAAVNNLLELLDGGEFMDFYRSRSLVTGERIRIITKDGEVSATAEGIEDDGALRVMLDSGETEILRSGEISIRKEE
jgi:BirA family biotin operon repressor/biotin-[acetyl-CoA-carboxylase] ligase